VVVVCARDITSKSSAVCQTGALQRRCCLLPPVATCWRQRRNCSCMQQCCERSHNALFSLCVQMLKDQMRELADSAESTMQELESMKTRAYSMTAQQQRCEYCSDLLLGKAFYLFPCSHGFHCQCLVQRCTQHLSPAQVMCNCTVLIATVETMWRGVPYFFKCVHCVYGSVVTLQLLLRTSGGAVQCVVP
jgi:hypothetical protein